MMKKKSIIKNNYKKKMQAPFPKDPFLDLLLKTIAQGSGKGILVGGCVRDHLLGHKIQDIDIEVYFLTSQELEKLLKKRFTVYSVGKNFGIFKTVVEIGSDKKSFDLALPRTESKSGKGHKGFVISQDPFMDFAKASQRRDFTINAMGLDLETNEILDPHGGLVDLKNKKLRHVSEAFSEDPLRVFRAAQFCARFLFKLDPTTIELCKTLQEELKTLSHERIYQEFKKLLLSQKPSLGFMCLRSCHAINIFPELKALIGCQQENEWHPEGDVWIHTLMVVDEAAKIISQESLPETTKLVVMAGALCHDLGKPSTTIFKDGRIKSPAHEKAGEEPTRKFLHAIGFPLKLHDQVVSLVKEHLKPHQLYSKRDEVSDGAIRRLATRVNIPHLLMVSAADFFGRTTIEALSGYDPSVSWLRTKVEQVLGADQSPRPILQGRHLIALGQKPGVHFSKILKEAFEAQMDGDFTDEKSGILWLKEKIVKEFKE